MRTLSLWSLVQMTKIQLKMLQMSLRPHSIKIFLKTCFYKRLLTKSLTKMFSRERNIRLSRSTFMNQSENLSRDKSTRSWWKISMARLPILATRRSWLLLIELLWQISRILRKKTMEIRTISWSISSTRRSCSTRKSQLSLTSRISPLVFCTSKLKPNNSFKPSSWTLFSRKWANLCLPWFLTVRQLKTMTSSSS